ncbi:MAG: peptide chain release factor-like protein [Phycisphaerae bacterium]|nr:peptide chain release factor-like protein [Phycisphaerae bacterium]
MRPETRDDWLSASDEKLLAGCDVHIYKASGPGGQHRNKVSSAVRLHHQATGVTAVANDSRSQHDNRRRALSRLRMNLALQLRQPAASADALLPTVVAECLHKPKKPTSDAPLRLQVGRKDARFWPVAAYLLDWLAEAEGKLAPVSARLGVSTGNITSILKSDRHLLAAAQTLRREHNQRPIS